MGGLLEFMFVNGITERILAQAYGEGGYSIDVYSPQPRQQTNPTPAPATGGQSTTTWRTPISTAAPDGDNPSAPVSSDDEVVTETPRPITTTTQQPFTREPEIFSSTGSAGNGPGLVLVGVIILSLAVILASIILLVKNLRHNNSPTSTVDVDTAGWNNWQR